MNMNMLKAAHTNNVKKFIFLSSSVVYPIRRSPCIESDLLDKSLHASYFGIGEVKRFIEKLCIMYSTQIRNPMTIIIIRPSNIYGPYDDFNPSTSHVTAALIRKVGLRQNPIEVWGAGQDKRDIIHIEDFLTALLRATAHVENGYEIFNIASGYQYSISTILKILISKSVRFNPKILYKTNQFPMIRTREIDITKAQTLLKFDPEFSHTRRLKDTLQWFKQYNKIGRL